MADADLRKLFRERLPDFDWVSVETHSTGRGVPDSYFCHESGKGWIEFKACDGWRCRVRPEQVAWAERHERHGGKVLTAVRRDRDELWIFAGKEMRKLVTQRLDAVNCLGKWKGGPGRWDWPAIRRLLTR